MPQNASSVREHWDEVYRAKQPDAVSWYQPTPEPSLRAVREFGTMPPDAMIDVGAGASSLVDALLQQGWSDLTVLDVSAAALAQAQARLGPAAGRVHWIVADATRWHPDRTYRVWHDRAVFHFLTLPGQRDAYREALMAGTASGSLVIMATFAPDGPERCSGLPVRRYDAAAMAEELGPAFELLGGWRKEHRTPNGGRQAFQWCGLRRS